MYTFFTEKGDRKKNRGFFYSKILGFNILSLLLINSVTLGKNIEIIESPLSRV